MRWHQNPQRVAWIILLANFTLCCLLSVAVPLAARQFILHATVPLTALVTTTAGTVQLSMPGANEPNAVSERREVPEGSQIATDSLARALVTVARTKTDQAVLARLQLFPDSALSLVAIRAPRYRWSQDPDNIVLALQRGRVRLVTSGGVESQMQVRLDIAQAHVFFGNGIFDIIVRSDTTQITAQEGSAEVIAANTQVALDGGQRVIVPVGQAPDLPVPAEQDLVRNGTFEGDIAQQWHDVVEVASGHQPGQIAHELMGERQVVRFVRRAEDGVPNRVGVTQTLDQDVQGHDSLVLSLDLQLLHQSVPGGGFRGSEYPLMVDLDYTDVYGKSLHWFQSFYYLDLPPGSDWDLPTGEKVPLGVWYTYESANLFDLLRDTPPAHLNAITVYARGHDYESVVSEVALTLR